MSSPNQPSSEDFVDGFDRHGFAVFRKGYDPDAERCHSCFRNESEIETNVERWQRLLADWDTSMRQNRHGVRLRRHLQAGIPHHLRGAVWKQLLDTEALREASSFNYKAQLLAVREQLVDLGISEYGGHDSVALLADNDSASSPSNGGHISVDCIRQILLDLDRSYPTHRKYLGRQGEALEGRAAMFRILATYARFNPDVGYCQGMSYVAGVFLMYMNETDAFWCFVSVLERPKYLRGYFMDHMARIQRHAVVFQRLVKKKLPHVNQHLRKLGVECLMFIAPWFLALFSHLPCWESVLMIWDLFLLDGIKALFQAGLSVLAILRDDLLRSHDLSSVLPLLLHPPREKFHYMNFAHTFWHLTLEDWEVRQLEAVVHEDSTRVHKRGRDELDGSTEVQSGKRQKMGDPEPSLFRRFVNIFTPREQRPTTAGSAKPVGAKPGRLYLPLQDSFGSDGEMHVSPCEEMTEDCHLVQNENTTPVGLRVMPVRRSPRLLAQRALKDVNTPTRPLAKGCAKTEYSFSAFKTPTPLRHSQQPRRRTRASFGSPEMELQSLPLMSRSRGTTPRSKRGTPRCKSATPRSKLNISVDMSPKVKTPTRFRPMDFK